MYKIILIIIYMINSNQNNNYQNNLSDYQSDENILLQLEDDNPSDIVYQLDCKINQSIENYKKSCYCYFNATGEYKQSS